MKRTTQILRRLEDLEHRAKVLEARGGTNQRLDHEVRTLRGLAIDSAVFDVCRGLTSQQGAPTPA